MLESQSSLSNCINQNVLPYFCSSSWKLWEIIVKNNNLGPSAYWRCFWLMSCNLEIMILCGEDELKICKHYKCFHHVGAGGLSFLIFYCTFLYGLALAWKEKKKKVMNLEYFNLNKYVELVVFLMRGLL